MMFGNIMYLRPGNLWKSFRVLKMHVDNVDGYAKNSYEDTDIAWLLTGCGLCCCGWQEKH